MCGICGFVRFNEKVSMSVLQRMNDAIKHRGPDDEGYVQYNDKTLISFSGDDTAAEIKEILPQIQSADKASVGLGFRRLSIQDISAKGHQPMFSSDRKIVITFNGEIYNFKELRKELEGLSYYFESATDTEVILNGYKEWGIDVVHRLNGMFSIALMDSDKERLYLIRDRIGIKPLFYHNDVQGVTWASEIKSILKAPWVQPSINWNGLLGNYQLQTTPVPATCFEGVHSIPPASYLSIDLNSHCVSEHSYWSIPIHQQTIKISKEDATKYLDEQLQNIVKIQLRSDVPVTSLMSGGIDSTTLTAICAQQNENFHAYSLGFDGTGSGADELPQAIAMAKKLGIHHHVHQLKPEDVLSNLEASLGHYEEPYFSLEPGLAAAEYLHKEGYKVVMNGLGADEVFGGYSHYLDYKNWQSRQKLSALKHFIPSANTYLSKVKNYLELDTVLKYFINSRIGMRPYEIAALSNKRFTPLGIALNEEKNIEQNIPEALYYYDLKYYVGTHHVYRDDLSAMRHSIEMRYPFLDHTLIEWVATLPMDIRYNGQTTKPLLRSVAEKYITRENLSMRKKGFTLPLDKWLNDNKEVEAFAKSKIDHLIKRELFNNHIIKQWWQKRAQGNYFSRIWQLVTTEVWLATYIDR